MIFMGGLIGVMYYVILQGELLTSNFSSHLCWPTAISFIRGERNSCHGRTCTSIIAHLISMLASDGRYTGSRIHDAHTLVRWKARPILYSILDFWLFWFLVSNEYYSLFCVFGCSCTFAKSFKITPLTPGRPFLRQQAYLTCLIETYNHSTLHKDNRTRCYAWTCI